MQVQGAMDAGSAAAPSAAWGAVFAMSLCVFVLIGWSAFAGPTMVGRTSDWSGELGRWHKPLRRNEPRANCDLVAIRPKADVLFLTLSFVVDPQPT